MKYSKAVETVCNFGSGETYVFLCKGYNEKHVLELALTVVSDSGSNIIIDLLTNDFSLNCSYIANIQAHLYNDGKRAFTYAISAIKKAIDVLMNEKPTLTRNTVRKALLTSVNAGRLASKLNIDLNTAQKLKRNHVLKFTGNFGENNAIFGFLVNGALPKFYINDDRKTVSIYGRNARIFNY